MARQILQYGNPFDRTGQRKEKKDTRVDKCQIATF